MGLKSEADVEATYMCHQSETPLVGGLCENSSWLISEHFTDELMVSVTNFKPAVVCKMITFPFELVSVLESSCGKL